MWELIFLFPSLDSFFGSVRQREAAVIATVGSSGDTSGELLSKSAFLLRESHPPPSPQNNNVPVHHWCFTVDITMCFMYSHFFIRSADYADICNALLIINCRHRTAHNSTHDLTCIHTDHRLYITLTLLRWWSASGILDSLWTSEQNTPHTIYLSV